MALVVPAVLPTSRKELEERLTLLASMPSVSRVQIDVVDGKFASPASWPYTNLAEFKSVAAQGVLLSHLDHLTYEVDLMCFDALEAAESWLALGVTRLTFHAESTTDLQKLLATARGRYGSGAFASELVSFGLALNLSSDLTLLESCLHEISYVQLMGIARIGVQGQPFDRRVIEKLRIFRERHPEVPVQIDGGVSLETAKTLTTLGVEALIVGSAIVKAVDPAHELEKFEALQSPYGV